MQASKINLYDLAEKQQVPTSLFRNKVAKHKLVLAMLVGEPPHAQYHMWSEGILTTHIPQESFESQYELVRTLPLYKESTIDTQAR